MPNIAPRTAIEAGRRPECLPCLNVRPARIRNALYRPPGADSAVLPGGNISDCTYRFMVRHVGKAMTASGTASGSNIEREPKRGSEPAMERGASRRRAVYDTERESGLYLQISNASLDHGASFQLANRNSGDHQRFVFIPSVTAPPDHARHKQQTRGR